MGIFCYDTPLVNTLFPRADWEKVSVPLCLTCLLQMHKFSDFVKLSDTAGEPRRVYRLRRAEFVSHKQARST